jgi:ABC-type uncharacterized transport system involved in gliding motility auxiliary subunit
MKKTRETLLFSVAGVVALFFALLALNFLAGNFKQRIDLTEDRAFTLSPGTRAILQKLDTPVQIRLYVTKGSSLPVDLRNYAARVEDTLKEFAQASHFIKLQKLDTEPDSDAEDSAELDGVTGLPTANGDPIFLGLSVSMLDRKSSIPFLIPERESLLEYEISRAISQVISEKKPVVGVMSWLPAFGSMNPMMMQMGMQHQPSWAFISELRQNFDVREIPPTSDSIPEDVNVLMVIHPKTITDSTQFALDQFVLRGGRLIALLDPFCVLDRQGYMGGPPSSSTLSKLLPAWGVSFNPTQTVADPQFGITTQRGRQPAVLRLNRTSFAADDVLTSGIEDMLVAFAGAYEITSDAASANIKSAVLAQSSPNAVQVDPTFVENSPEAALRGAVEAGKPLPLALRLTGKFKTAFPNGKPNVPAAEGTEAGEEKKEETDTALKESTTETSIVLIGDADFIQDPLAIREIPNLFGQRLLMPANGNLSFAQSAVEQLAGDENLIAVRSRAAGTRPFTVVQQMQAEAEKQYQGTIENLEQELRAAETKLNELQRSKEKGQEYILSPDQKKELEKVRKTEAEVRQQLKQTRRDLAKDIDALEIRLKWLNIAVMPALVAVFGIAFFFVKRQRAAAR